VHAGSARGVREAPKLRAIAGPQWHDHNRHGGNLGAGGAGAVARRGLAMASVIGHWRIVTGTRCARGAEVTDCQRAALTRGHGTPDGKLGTAGGWG
jgi:hypothetical protein